MQDPLPQHCCKPTTSSPPKRKENTESEPQHNAQGLAASTIGLHLTRARGPCLARHRTPTPDSFARSSSRWLAEMSTPRASNKQLSHRLMPTSPCCFALAHCHCHQARGSRKVTCAIKRRCTAPKDPTTLSPSQSVASQVAPSCHCCKCRTLFIARVSTYRTEQVWKKIRMQRLYSGLGYKHLSNFSRSSFIST
jgi:hypothetical protein